MSDTRIEKDSVGDMTVPANAYYGAQTQRAVENFPISGYRFGRRFIHALGLVKRSAAKVNKLDVEGALKHVHPTAYSEYTHLPQKALVAIDKKTLLEVCKAIFPSLRIRVGPPQNLKVVVKVDMAYATYESNERIGDGPPMMVRRTEIFVRENKEWLLTHSHRSILQGE